MYSMLSDFSFFTAHAALMYKDIHTYTSLLESQCITEGQRKKGIVPIRMLCQSLK